MALNKNDVNRRIRAMERIKQVLTNWKFAVGESKECLKAGKYVGTIHTWNAEEETADHAGYGWYEHELKLPEGWKNKRIWIHFGAVYHDAEVYLNEEEIGVHSNSGYTPFDMELTKALQPGQKNVLRVRACNAYSDQMLPYLRSFDWANDGGMIREAYLYATGENYIESVQVTAQPVILTENRRQEKGAAIWGLQADIAGKADEELALEWTICRENDAGAKAIFSGTCKASAGGLTQRKQILEKKLLEEIDYWHFDAPNLYVLKAVLWKADTGSEEWRMQDCVIVNFGFRDFHVKGPHFYLNGERVRLSGTEWMPGSDPVYGMAEPKAQLEKMLTCLKESNCVFTRFHWQQDDAVYDWCDRHGMLVQEEIPFWGAAPKTVESTQWEIARQQFEEMFKAHANHPSIIAWGVGNELSAQKSETNRYIRHMIAYAHEKDPVRTVNYVSNSYWANAEIDGTRYGDIMMINEYAGTWMSDCEPEDLIRPMLDANPDMPLVPSEFGLCEPVFSGGDVRRKELFAGRMETYRTFPQIAGTINFCLNDYRTQMGEEGEGTGRCRVHGSTYLDGEKKPSYWTVQKECAPFVISREADCWVVTCRNDLPCYELKGYLAEFLSEDGELISRSKLPDLLPGENCRIEISGARKVKVLRPTGDWAGTFEIAE